MPEDIHWKKYAARFKTYPVIIPLPQDQPDMVICIPVYAEPDLLFTLESLLRCEQPKGKVELILLFNLHPESTPDEKEKHLLYWKNCLEWIQKTGESFIQMLPLYVEEVNTPKGGVGWARKLAMDEAARRMGPKGVIICLDADCIVSQDYLQEIENHFTRFPSCEAASVYFEHPLDGLSDARREAIVQYELHLRYLVHAMRWSGHPFAYQTVGSAMVVRRDAYLRQGGMNTRQAGEDFYFLQKFIELGHFREIHQTTVYPSSRESGRVPFGTGKAMLQLQNDPNGWKTIDLRVYEAIRPLFHGLKAVRAICREGAAEKFYDKIGAVLHLSAEAVECLKSLQIEESCFEIAAHTASEESFRHRFFRTFNAFWMIRYTHVMSNTFFPRVPVLQAAAALLPKISLSLRELPPYDPSDAESILHLYRALDRGVMK